jgi:neutral ceramidase
MAAEPSAAAMATAASAPWLMVGAAVTEVPIAAGTPMSGFAARTEPSAGVHDPLTVRALVIEDACWLTIDVCGLDEATCLSIRKAAPLPTDRIIVSATHTHSGPCSMTDRLGHADPAVVEALCRAAVKTCTEAVDNRTLCSVSLETIAGLGIAHNRRHPEVPIDPALQVIAFTGSSGSVTAWLLQFPCHPVVLGADNRLISADYQGFARQSLEAHAPASVALFLTGAAGDVNTGHSAESSYLQGGSPTRTFAEAERIGEALGKAGRSVLAAPARPAHPFAVLTTSIELELDVLDEAIPDALAAQWGRQALTATSGEQALLRIWSDWARAQDGSAELRWTGTITVMRISDILLVALPGEPFLAAAEQIQREFELPVIVAGYSNGCPGYFPTAAEYDRGGYEVLDAHRYYGMPAPFKRGSLERLVRTAVTLGRQLR